MINGFIIEITNENNQSISVSLFKANGIPEGVTINAKNSHYNYSSLFLMAIHEGFKGSGLSTDDTRIDQVTIYKDNIPTSYEFIKILHYQPIIIDGVENFITIIVPASSKTLLQLIPEID